MVLTSLFLYFVVWQCICHFLGVQGMELVSIQPKSARVSNVLQEISVMCLASEPISHCQFNWRKENSFYSNGLLMDVSQGDEVKHSVPLKFSSAVMWYRYMGKGLADGECGITLQIKGDKRYTLGCRFRSETSGWYYGYMPLHATNYEDVDLTVSKKQVVAVGGEARFQCNARSAIAMCEFRVPGFQPLSLYKGSENVVSVSHPGLRYLGRGLERGDCGIVVEQVSDKMSGHVSCSVETDQRSTDFGWRTIPLIVISAPENLNITVFPNGRSAQIECRAGPSRPPAEIRWSLGGKPVGNGLKDNGDGNQTWRWVFDLQTSSQMLDLQDLEEPKELSCMATHLGLTEPMVVKQSTPVLDPSVVSKCPPVTHPTLDTECSLFTDVVNCSSDMEVGTVASLVCKKDHVNIDSTGVDSSNSQCVEGGVWKPKPIQQCKKVIVCPPFSIPTMEMECWERDVKVNCNEGVTSGTQAFVSCRSGYGPRTSLSLLCQENGNWNQNIPICRAKEFCPPITSIGENVNVKCDSSGYNSKCTRETAVGIKATLSCARGFTATTGLNQTECKPGGKWEGDSLLKCEAAAGCSPLVDFPGSATCEKDGVTLGDCSQSSRPGTIARYTRMAPMNIPCESQCLDNGNWNTLLQNCVINKQCPPMEVSNAEVTCSLEGTPVSCSDFVKPDTVATISCSRGYSVSHKMFATKQFFATTVKCLVNGNWNNTKLYCEPDCGQRNFSESQNRMELPGGFLRAFQGEFPWHVGLYLLYENGSIIHHCGATLIQESFVLTAAHCIYNTTYKRVIEASLLKVVAGTTNVLWDNEVERGKSQQRNVKDVTMHDQYDDQSNNYALDIAILKVATPIKITQYVNIACIDWSNEYKYHEIVDGTNNVGLVAGWGITNTEGISPFLRFLDLPFIPYRTCINALKRNRALTGDKFCAGYFREGKSLCPGDSGGGLVISEKKLSSYFLAGITSVQFPSETDKKKCATNQYNAFTALNPTIVQWIKGIIE